MAGNFLRLDEALDAVTASADGLYGVLLNHGTLEVGFYQPKLNDQQQPHAKDEVYVVQAGSARFTLADETQDVVVGDALFVAAGVLHHFSNFSDDFAAWVIFYGPDGGEQYG
jgi:mannose-6-phosphate isomerase-like protein (cupin superfamily)